MLQAGVLARRLLFYYAVMRMVPTSSKKNSFQLHCASPVSERLVTVPAVQTTVYVYKLVLYVVIMLLP